MHVVLASKGDFYKMSGLMMILNACYAVPTGAALLILSGAILLLAIVLHISVKRMDAEAERLHTSIEAIRLPLSSLSARVAALRGVASAAYEAASTIASLSTATNGSLLSSSSLMNQGLAMYRGYRAAQRKPSNSSSTSPTASSPTASTSPSTSPSKIPSTSPRVPCTSH